MSLEEQARAFGREHPGWEAWQDINGGWHARLKGATPPVMVHGESPEGLAAETKRWEGEHEFLSPCNPRRPANVPELDHRWTSGKSHAPLLPGFERW
jgi:hypothetical protein